MAKNPILPLYYNDILGSTKTWTDEEFGAYMRLLIEQWDKGGLPKDYQRLTRLATSLSTTWPLLKDKFPEVDGLLKNAVMEQIREKRARHNEKQVENIRKRYQNSTKHITKRLPLENEYENENEKDTEVKGVQGETPQGPANFEQAWSWAFDSLTLENFTMTFSEANIPEQLQRFRLKCDNDPATYHYRDVAGLRNAFGYQLEHARPKRDTKTLAEQKSAELKRKIQNA